MKIYGWIVPPFPLLSAMVLLMGCSTTQTPLNQATVPHFSRMPPQVAQAGQTATLVIVRDQGHYKIDALVEVFIDQRKRGELDTEEKAVFHVEPGSVEIAIKPYFEPWQSLTATIAAGETQVFRIGFYDDPFAWVPVIGWFAHDTHTYIRPYEVVHGTP